NPRAPGVPAAEANHTRGGVVSEWHEPRVDQILVTPGLTRDETHREFHTNKGKKPIAHSHDCGSGPIRVPETLRHRESISGGSTQNGREPRRSEARASPPLDRAWARLCNYDRRLDCLRGRVATGRRLGTGAHRGCPRLHWCEVAHRD